MKKKILSWAAFLLLTFGGSQAGFCQEKTLPELTVTAKSNITKAVRESFEKTFPDAENQQWSKVNKNFLVRFISEEQKNHALFTKSGYLIYHITYGTEANMPEDLRKKVQSTYQPYSITRVAHVRQADRDIWVVNLETDKKLVLARVEEGEVEEVGNYEKTL
ncbi:MAG: hypothetical protein Q8927_16650 [Bacteroidota bacterium]|nr:hypothetical protein [Bacteroidota bacterium]MDP4245256.1 hypothetical protein [Bacteroidota bacterium]MDP4255872.1 hypothetical protein [Bacteroidota bacterium]MDP4260287.1 hypothetical protein [Bacteroidota bacterium]